MAEPNLYQSSLNFQANIFGPFWPKVWSTHLGLLVHYSGPLKVPQEFLRPLRTIEGQSGSLGLLDVPMDASRFFKTLPL